MHSLQAAEKRDMKHDVEVTEKVGQFNQELGAESVMKKKRNSHQTLTTKLPLALSHQEK